MAPTWQPSSNECPAVGPFHDGDLTVVGLRGELDLSTVDPITEALADAIVLDDADLVVDLSEVEFMDASTVVVLIRVRRLLALRSRVVTFRAPSASAQWVLEMCGLTDLVDSPRGEGAGTTGARKLRLVDTATAEPEPPVTTRRPNPASTPLTG